MNHPYPSIQILSETEKTGKDAFFTKEVEMIIHHLFPPQLFLEEDPKQVLRKALPVICWTPFRTFPSEITFYLCCAFRIGAYQFFHEMLTLWLIPGKKINSPIQFCVDFCFPELGEQKYSAGLIRVQIEEKTDYLLLQHNLSRIESEIRLGVSSSYHAARILEIKGLSTSKKTALIQERLVHLVKKRPHYFDYNILTEMQHFLVLCRSEFKMQRDHRHLSRIIVTIYLFKNSLKLGLELSSQKRIVYTRLIRLKGENKKPILGFVIALSFLREDERLRTKHILNALRNLVPSVQLVKGSFFFHQEKADHLCTFYLEIEKAEFSSFSFEELTLLKNSLGEELKGHIEQIQSPLFFTQNEEMILRSIIQLSEQLKLVRDLPQVMITFHEQTGKKLEFLVIIARVLKPSSSDIHKNIDLNPSELEIHFDRQKIVGTLRKRYPKEVHVLRVQIPKQRYLRQDQSVDLLQAREAIAKELRHLIGDFRDFNGGFISKEREPFDKLKSSLSSMGTERTFLLENFFYSLTPVIMRSCIPSEALKSLFLLLIKAKQEGLQAQEQHQCYHSEEEKFISFIIVGTSRSFKKIVCQSVEKKIPENILFARSFLHSADLYFLGFIVEKTVHITTIHLRNVIEKSLEEWKQKVYI